MRKKQSRKTSKTSAPKIVVGKTMIEAAKTARLSAQVLGNEFFGVTLLSTVGGFVDTSGFIALFTLFTAHVTGDLITAAAALTEKLDVAGIVRLLMIPIFMLTIALATLFLRFIRRKGATSIAPLLAIETVLLAGFAAAGHFLHPLALNANSWGVALIGGIGVAAMGIQNSLMRGALRSFSGTTMMTGNLAQFTIDFVERFFPPKSDNPSEKKLLRAKCGARMRKSGFPLLGFMVGAAAGAYLTKVYGLISIVVPAGIVAVLTVITLVRSRRR
jgi:uncharacterized membrane protein YoaK (UPF0700 family)